MRLSGRVVRSGLCGGLFALAVAGTSAGAAEYSLTTVADNLDSPWSVVQLPDTGFLVTQRGGQLLRLAPDGIYLNGIRLDMEAGKTELRTAAFDIIGPEPGSTGLP